MKLNLTKHVYIQQSEDVWRRLTRQIEVSDHNFFPFPSLILQVGGTVEFIQSVGFVVDISSWEVLTNPIVVEDMAQAKSAIAEAKSEGWVIAKDTAVIDFEEIQSKETYVEELQIGGDEEEEDEEEENWR